MILSVEEATKLFVSNISQEKCNVPNFQLINKGDSDNLKVTDRWGGFRQLKVDKGLALDTAFCKIFTNLKNVSPRNFIRNFENLHSI